ncbi:hypothetical protein LPJ55_000641 [Coemansia sp. RSA 990]|nr:condensin complex component cnd2 [Coemansia mojavensis]KAJ1743324.1 hypothetical protein LPJ68_001118 [Coemansia sp. RSA 1086]KAJ1752960.1 hypothetical protein LPJ79_000782 [Coemansia sp. RSA 1821]KAJ1875476.1 hypothetical protein LPJ55_000641 [Coemansia sp. RSA 990]KAJ2674940.1 hypothetical protein IWW42_001442 [Coemansia sp. RSA 1085]
MYTPRHSTGGAQELTTPHSAGTPQTPRLNDDAAERKRRRKSAIERRRSNLVTPHRISTKTSLFNQSPQLTSPAPFAVQLPRLTPEELNQRYEEWMKIAADNKINANNTWDFALIDYFYDMSLLREGDSINFQKASCTLDGCVKIYSSRVDSVASETGRLLSGLAEAPGKRGRQTEDVEEEADGDKQKSRRQTRSATTLAKDFASISVKQLDLEFAVDPLFKKTSADFDEGGARGLLLNHLGFDADGRIVFDASDSSMLVDSEAEADTDVAVDEQSDAEETELSETTDQKVPVSKKHRPTAVDLSSLGDIFGSIMQNIDSAEICPSLADFGFTRDTSLDFSLLREHLEEEPDVPVSAASDDLSGDFGDSSNDVNNFEDDGDDMGHFLNFGDEDDGPMPLETASTLQQAEAEQNADEEEGAVAFGPSSLKMAEDEDNLLSYFDTKLAKGWAGPEHWRLPISRATMQRQQQSGTDDAGNADDADAKRKRTEKHFTDFMNGADVKAETLFAKPPRASAITMSKKAAQNQNHTLPEDVHFSSKNLFNLVLKPQLRFNPRRVMAGSSTSAGSSAAAAGGGGYGGFVVDADNGMNVYSGLDNPQFGDDNDGMPRFDDGDDYDDDMMRMTAEAEKADDETKPDIPALKLIKPLYVNYARKAKRVNVKKLKENIWREMAASTRRESQVMGLAEPADIPLDEDDDSIILTGNQKFSSIISSLKNVYPPEKLEELSVSFCFICLLHLANERNLRIEGDSSLHDLVISQDRFD